MSARHRNLQAGGVHAIMFGNENDRPYLFKAPAESIAAMTAVITRAQAGAEGAVRRQLPLGPFGERRDRRATGAALRSGDLDRAVRLRHGACGSPTPRDALKLRPQSRPRRHETAVQHQRRIRRTRWIRGRSTLRARSAVFSSLADAILVSGPLTGQSAEMSDLREVAAAVPEVPVLRQYRRQYRQCRAKCWPWRRAW